MTQWFIGALMAVVCGADARNLEEKIPVPHGPQPQHAIAVLDKGGNVQLRQVVLRYVPVKRPVTVENNGVKETRQVTEMRMVPQEVMRQVPAARVQVYEVNGKRLNPPTWTKRLKKETQVLVSVNGKKVDPFYLQVVKEGTLILVPPAPARNWPAAEAPAPPPRKNP